jgi:hypothetical protein
MRVGTSAVAEPAKRVAIGLFHQIRIDSDGERLLAQRGQADLGPQEPGDGLRVPGLRVRGGLLLTEPPPAAPAAR